MKKRIWSLVLCLMLVCAGFVGCGSKDDASAAPEEMVKVKLQEFVDSVSEALEKTQDSSLSMKNVGYDLTAEVGVSEQIASQYGLTGLSSLGLKMTLDAKDNAQMRIAGNLLLNAQEVIAAEGIVTQDSVYMNLPGYSKDYLGVSFEEILGKSIEDYVAEVAAANEGLPTREDVADMWKSFSTKFIDAFEYQNKEEKQTIGIGDYKLTGNKYITTAKSEDVVAAFNMLVDEMKKFPKLEVEEYVSFDGLDTFNANYYTGKKGAYAWEFEGVKGEKSASVVFVSLEKGFSFYVVDEDGKEQQIAFSERESDQKGKITICADEEFVVEYDNYSKDSVDLSTTLNGMALKFKVRSKEDGISLDFNLNVLGIIVAGKLEGEKGNFDLDASMTMSGVAFGTLKLNAKARDFVDYEIPSSSVGPDEWSAGIDQEKLIGDLSQLMMQFPFLMDMMQ